MTKESFKEGEERRHRDRHHKIRHGEVEMRKKESVRIVRKTAINSVMNIEKKSEAASPPVPSGIEVIIYKSNHYKGHSDDGSLLLLLQGVEIPESVTNLTSKRWFFSQKGKKERFQIAAKAGCDLGLKWLERLDEEEKHLLTENECIGRKRSPPTG